MTGLEWKHKMEQELIFNIMFPTCVGYPDHMVFSEFRRRFDVLAPHLTKKHGRNYIVKDEKRVSHTERRQCVELRLM